MTTPTPGAAQAQPNANATTDNADASASLTLDDVRALIGESLGGFEKKLANIVNSAVTSQIARIKPQPDAQAQAQQSQQQAQGEQAARVDPQLVRMQEEIAKLREQTERSEAARRDVEQRAQRESARRGLADALSAKGITGARQRAVIADLESRGAFKIEEDGSPSLTVERVRVKGARATEMAHRNLSEAVEDWVQTDDAKEFLPAVVNAAGKPSAARMPAGQAKTFDLTTEEGAAAAALALLGGD